MLYNIQQALARSVTWASQTVTACSCRLHGQDKTVLSCLVCVCWQYEQAIKVHAYSVRLIQSAGGPVLLLLDSESEWAVAWEGESSGPQGSLRVSNCSQLRSDWSQVLTNNWQYLVHGCTALSLTDHTLNVLLDHLRDLDLATILARLADRSEPALVDAQNLAIAGLSSPK